MLTVGVVEVPVLLELLEFPDVPVPLALVPVAVFVAAAVSLLNFARLFEMKSVSATTIPEAPMRIAVYAVVKIFLSDFPFLLFDIMHTFLLSENDFLLYKPVKEEHPDFGDDFTNEWSDAESVAESH